MDCRILANPATGDSILAEPPGATDRSNGCGCTGTSFFSSSSWALPASLSGLSPMYSLKNGANRFWPSRSFFTAARSGARSAILLLFRNRNVHSVWPAERGQVADAGVPQIEPLQVLQAGQRPEIGDRIGRQVEGVYLRQPGQRRDVLDLVVRQVQRAHRRRAWPAARRRRPGCSDPEELHARQSGERLDAWRSCCSPG